MVTISILVFSIFVKSVLTSCPFANIRQTRSVIPQLSPIEEKLLEAFHQSLNIKGLDEETKTRTNPSQKNLFGNCPVEKCHPDSKYRTWNGFCNNLNQDRLAYGRSTSILNRILPPLYGNEKDTPKVSLMLLIATANFVNNISIFDPSEHVSE